MVQRAHRRHRSDRGASLVEAAIVAPVILLIVFSIIELSFAYRSASVTTAAARAGARLAAAQYGDADTAAQQLTVRNAIANAVSVSIEDLKAEATPTRLLVYEADANGNPLSGTTAVCGASCIEFTWDDPTKSFVYSGGSWTDPDNCGVVLDRVGVHVEVDHESVAPFAGITLNIDERTIMRLEPGAFDTCLAE